MSWSSLENQQGDMLQSTFLFRKTNDIIAFHPLAESDHAECVVNAALQKRLAHEPKRFRMEEEEPLFCCNAMHYIVEVCVEFLGNTTGFNQECAGFLGSTSDAHLDTALP